MRPARLLVPGILVVSAAACAASGRTDGFDPTLPAATTGGDGGGAEEAAASATPHALGTIVLGEIRRSGGGGSSPVIAATFVPDAALARTCTRKLGACEIADAPKCTTGGISGCGTGETCTYDDACTAKCVKVCAKTCGAGERCELQGTSPVCVKADRFDAGAIAFAGTTQAITLFPPYDVTPTGNGAPFMARAELRAQASGGAVAGFEAFDETFTSTTFLESNPPLRELPLASVMGSGAIEVGWVPGADTVHVNVSGATGVAKCIADDGAGSFSIPRQVVREVTGGGTASGALTISVTRERREVRKGKKVFGELSGGRVVQPEGWLELVTQSTDAHSFQPCATGQAVCGERCVALATDTANCGACGNVCPTGYYCSAGRCY